jgi:hypothetical protein
MERLGCVSTPENDDWTSNGKIKHQKTNSTAADVISRGRTHGLTD